MGNVFGTTGLSVIATIVFVVGAILLLIADDKLRNITGYNANNNLQAAHNDLVVGIILAWIAAGLALILMLGYILVTVKVLENEWVHFIVWLLAAAAAIISIIYMGIGMRKINNDSSNDNGSFGYLLAAMILMGVGLVILIILGLWRMTHRGEEGKQMEQEDKINDSQTTHLLTTNGTGHGHQNQPSVSGYSAETL